MDEASVQESCILTILSIGYRARCSVTGCGNLAQTILRYADRGRAPFVQPGKVQSSCERGAGVRP